MKILNGCCGVVGALLFLFISHVSYADTALYTPVAPIIDGNGDESLWQQGQWYNIDNVLIGGALDDADFAARYTLRWNRDALYILVEITDDILNDSHADPLDNYWNDDCLEIFIDADKSGGDHFNNYNAFAYHVALDNQVVDIGPDENGNAVPSLYNQHLTSRWTRQSTPPYVVHWEIALKVFNDSYMHRQHEKQVPLVLTKNMQLGFMLAYCDADSGDREHMISSHDIKPVKGDKNLGYKDASVFDTLRLLP